MKHSKLKKIVLIGASTGGPGQIQKIISALPKLQNTTLIIAQHMVYSFMDSFTSRLQNISHNSISLVKDNQTLQSHNIYVLKGETTLIDDVLSMKHSSLNTYNPNINIAFNSFVSLCEERELLCVILTGIGDDGVEACKNLSLSGARCITESAESAIVDGMPSRARLLVPNIEVYHIDEIVKIISEFCE